MKKNEEIFILYESLRQKYRVVNGYFIVEGNPGDQKQVTVNLSNSSDKASANGEFMLADAPNAVGGGIGAIDPEHFEQKQVGSWFKVNKQTIQLNPGESRDLILDFTIPAGAGLEITLEPSLCTNWSQEPNQKNHLIRMKPL